ncbi:alpha/beta fold hydrolase [Stenotrophomonas sp. Iso1]|uniref:alpha/beta fold hydrolase n=1 Tax=Stenotrophomonas sp. Iso1 TaxID=2977283 RepID=UPI0022B7D4BF|nr:alpha/beta fold hydrolase [Stenotrophomonas sp. Iso1]
MDIAPTGNPPEKIPLLLLPGLLNDATLWRAQLEALADIADCQVGDLTRHDSLRATAEDVLSHAPPRFALAGFSLGGYIAQEILRIAPERVTHLALLDTSFKPDSPERAAQRIAQQNSVRMPGTFHGFGDTLMRSYIDASRLHDQVLVETVRGMTSRLGADVFLRQSRIERVDGSEVLRQWRGPTLVICGKNDAITPLTVSEQMAALLPQATLVVIPQCGHLAPLEKPQEVSAAMREWLVAPSGDV